MKYLLIVVFTVSLWSCKKKEDDPIKEDCSNAYHYALNSADLLSARFRTGTYWVFRDSVTLELDSEYVMAEQLAQYKDPENCDLYDYYAYNTKIDTFARINVYLINWNGILKSPTSVKDGNTIYKDYAKTKQNGSLTTYDSLYVYDRYYYNVIKASVAKDTTFNNKKTVYYTNSAVGVLKIEIYQNDSTLSTKKLLIRKNIIK